jgi:hypothetical protein
MDSMLYGLPYNYGTPREDVADDFGRRSVSDIAGARQGFPGLAVEVGREFRFGRFLTLLVVCKAVSGLCGTCCR